MKLGKARDQKGIAAEMIKLDCELLHLMIFELFNDVLESDRKPPREWMMTKLIVIFKKGDPQLPSNYRPIAILPILYKLFSRMLCMRIQPTLIAQQSTDQAAYRQGFSTEDHLLAARLIIEGCREYQADLYIGLVDFEKAFDTVDHTALWSVLASHLVPLSYINILQELYRNQIATVATDVESRAFGLHKGVKQGDPISALLFILVMDRCMQNRCR